MLDVGLDVFVNMEFGTGRGVGAGGGFQRHAGVKVLLLP